MAKAALTFWENPPTIEPIYAESGNTEGIFVRMEKCCCFTGHRPQKLPWGSDEWDWRCVALKERILLLIRELYREGYRHFITGMALGIDTYCCEMVLRLKEEHNDVVLEAALPCRSQDSGWSRKDRERYRRLVAQCDLQTLVQEAYTRDCMFRRDRYMVSRAECVIGIYDGVSSGGTRVTLTYALEQQKEVKLIDLGDFES